MDTPESFGSWVKSTRRALGLTQNEFAQLVYCATVTVRKIEYGTLRPSQQLAVSILEKVGVPPEEREPLIRLARIGPEPSFVRAIDQLRGFFGQQN